MTPIPPSEIRVGDHVSGLGGVVTEVLRNNSAAHVLFTGAKSRMDYNVVGLDALAHATITRPGEEPAAPAAPRYTPEELDRRRAEEAERRWRAEIGLKGSTFWYGILVEREGWTPPEPVDPDLLAAREIVARQHDPYATGSPWHANEAKMVRAGEDDTLFRVADTLAGIRHGREHEAARGEALAKAVEEEFTGPNTHPGIAYLIAAYRAYRASSTKGRG